MDSLRTLWQLQLQAWRDPVQRRRLLFLLLLGPLTLPLVYWLPTLLPSKLVLLGGVELSGTVLVWGLRSFFLFLVSLWFLVAYGRTLLAQCWDRTLPFPVALAKGVATSPAIATVYELVQLFILAFLGGLTQQYLFPLVGFLLWELLLAVQLVTFHLFNPHWGIPSFYTVYASGRGSTALKVAIIAAGGAAVHEFNDAAQQIANRKSAEQIAQVQAQSKVEVAKLQEQAKVELAKQETERFKVAEQTKIELAKIKAQSKKGGGWFSLEPPPSSPFGIWGVAQR